MQKTTTRSRRQSSSREAGPAEAASLSWSRPAQSLVTEPSERACLLASRKEHAKCRTDWALSLPLTWQKDNITRSQEERRSRDSRRRDSGVPRTTSALARPRIDPRSRPAVPRHPRGLQRVQRAQRAQRASSTSSIFLKYARSCDLCALATSTRSLLTAASACCGEPDSGWEGRRLASAVVAAAAGPLSPSRRRRRFISGRNLEEEDAAGTAIFGVQEPTRCSGTDCSRESQSPACERSILQP